MPSANVAYTGTLTPTTVSTVTLYIARGSIRVVNQSSTGIYFTVASDGATPATPTVGGADEYYVPGVIGASEEVLVGQTPPVLVSLISAGAAPFTVEADHPSRH